MKGKNKSKKCGKKIGQSKTWRDFKAMGNLEKE